jgi:hypothetical protein
MDSNDTELKHILQRWADRQALPPNGRTRLVGHALTASSKPETSQSIPGMILPTDLASWATVYFMGRTSPGLRMVS